MCSLKGVEAIFLVTNFWEHLFTGKSAIQSGDAEAAQALTVVKIADKLPGLKHFIWSTLPGNVEGVRKPILSVDSQDFNFLGFTFQLLPISSVLKEHNLTYPSKQSALRSNISTAKRRSTSKFGKNTLTSLPRLHSSTLATMPTTSPTSHQ